MVVHPVLVRLMRQIDLVLSLHSDSLFPCNLQD